MYNIQAESRLIPEKMASHHPDFAPYLRDAGEVLMDVKITICRINGCEKGRKGRSSLCTTHEHNWYKYKSIEAPIKEEILIPEGYVQACNLHGPLKEGEVYRQHGGSATYKLYLRCKQCSNAATRRWEKNNPEAVKINKFKAYRKQARYNSLKSIIKQKCLTEEQYLAMFVAQDNKCAICGLEETKKSQLGNLSPLSVDHCHETGLTRQLLCHHCNAGLGHFKDNPELFMKAGAYVSEWKKKHKEIMQ